MGEKGPYTAYNELERRRIERNPRKTLFERLGINDGRIATIGKGIRSRLQGLSNPNLRFWSDHGSAEGSPPERITPEAAIAMLTPALCARLLARGIIPTWHERFDDGTVDPVGRVYDDSGSLTEEPDFPVDPKRLAYVLLRKIGTKVASPIPPFDYDEYLKMVNAKEGEPGLGFGHPEKGLIDADAMGVAMCDVRYVKGKLVKTWAPHAEVLPLMEFAQHPNMQAIHYGSALFEGCTAELDEEGNVCVFDLEGHYNRLNEGARALDLPTLPSFEFFKDAVIRVIKANHRFIPPYGKGRLYIRPNLVDVGPRLKVKGSHLVALNFTASPIGNAKSYFGSVKKEVVMAVPRTHVRAVEGGIGDAKAAGNYARTILAIRLAEAMGLPVVGYLDHVLKDGDTDDETAEFRETNASNLFALKDLGKGRWKFITPPLNRKDILGGRTRALLLKIVEELGWEVEEGPLSLEEVRNKKYKYMGACGTAAYITPIHGIQEIEIGAAEELGPVDAAEEEEWSVAPPPAEQQSSEQKQHEENARLKRIARKVGEEVKFQDKKLEGDELFPEPFKQMMAIMEEVKRGGRMDDSRYEGLVTKFRLDGK